MLSGPGHERRAGWLDSSSSSRRRTACPLSRRRSARRVPNWGIGDRIYLGERTLQVVGRRDEDADQPPVLVVEDVAEKALAKRLDPY
jgi:hypothetical protein